MDTKYDLVQRIDNAAKLSKGQRRISDYILKHYDKAAFMTASKLGKAANVSESTIVRFAVALGYDGYPQLQQAIQELVRNRLTAAQRMEIAPDVRAGDIVAMILKSDLQNLRYLLENVQIEIFEQMKKAILSARNIYVLGLRGSAPLAQFLGYYLNYIFSNVHLITQGGSEVREQLARIGQGDVLIGISFPRYSNRTIESMRFADAQGALTIAITDSLSAPMGQTASLCITARSSMASFVDSLVAPMSLINALIVALSIEKKQELSAYFAKLEDIWTDTAIYNYERSES